MYTTKEGMFVGSSWEELGIKYSRPGGKAKCPACKDKRKRENVNDTPLSFVDDHYAKCHNCGQEWLVNRDGYSVAPTQKEYKLPSQDRDYEWCDPNVLQYFEKRGISGETLRKLKVISGDAYMPQVKKEVNTIQFNYFENGKLINVKYRDGQKNFKMEKDAKLIFYNIDALYNTDDYIIITEGEIDALSYIEAGISNVVSVPNGASKGSMNLEYLNHHIHLFEDAGRKLQKLKPLKRIILAFDNDEAGLALQKEFIRRLTPAKVWLADMQGFNDPNELLQKKGKVAVYNSFDKATAAPLTDIKTVYDLRAELEELRKNGLKPGAQVGSERFRELISFEVPRMTIITGVSTHGKSEFLDDIISRLAVFEGWRFALFSPENFPIEYHISKIVSKITGKAFNDVSGLELEECLEFISKHFVWIYPDDENYTLENLLNITDNLIARYGVNALIIDPWTEVDKLGKTGTEDINEWLSIMNRYKRNNGVHMFLVAHPRKMSKDEAGDVLIPDLMDISGSGHFYNKTDYGITVYRKFSDDTVLIKVNKVKFKHLGKIGETTMKYNLQNGRYEDKRKVDEGDGWDDRNWLHLEEQMEANLQFDPPTIIAPSGEQLDRTEYDDLPF